MIAHINHLHRTIVYRQVSCLKRRALYSSARSIKESPSIDTTRQTARGLVNVLDIDDILHIDLFLLLDIKFKVHLAHKDRLRDGRRWQLGLQTRVHADIESSYSTNSQLVAAINPEQNTLDYLDPANRLTPLQRPNHIVL